MNASWQNTDQNGEFNFEDRNHIPSKDQTKRYLIAKVIPGTYYLKELSGEYWYMVYGYRQYSQNVEIGPFKYSKDTSSLTFTVNPGEIKYLGDIEFIEEKTTEMSKFKIHRCFDDAKKFMQINYKQFSDQLTEGNLINYSETSSDAQNL